MARYDDALVERLIAGLPRRRVALVSPEHGARRSTLVVFQTDGRPADTVHATLAAAGVDVAVREGAVRLSPHLYNTAADIDRALTALAG